MTREAEPTGAVKNEAVNVAETAPDAAAEVTTGTDRDSAMDRLIKDLVAAEIGSQPPSGDTPWERARTHANRKQ